MEPDFWHERWQANEIGFHEGRANDLLVRHLAALGLPPGARLFLPLCGKAQDIPWLMAQGYEVVGIDLSPIAVSDLFREIGKIPSISGQGALTRHEIAALTVFAGDIFALDAAQLGPVDAVYDRAALVALPGTMRESYAAQIRALAPDAARLVIAFEYDQSVMEGPPFSVPEEEMVRLFAADYTLELLERQDVPGGLKGQAPATEAAWLLTPR